MFFLATALILLTIANIAGAFVSVGVRSGSTSALWLYLTSMVSMTAWVLMMKSPIRMTFATILFDVMAAGIYLIVMVSSGEPLTPLHAAGAIIALLGVVFMSL